MFRRIRKALENKTNMEDDRVAILETQLSQAKLIAEEADKKYEEVRTLVFCWKRTNVFLDFRYYSEEPLIVIHCASVRYVQTSREFNFYRTLYKI